MNELINLNAARAFKSDDATKWSVRDMLEYALNTLDKKDIKPRKAVLIILDDDDSKYDVRFVQAGLHCSEIITLLEYQKGDMLDRMKGKE